MSNKRRNLFYKNGFTLIELIVVFTVIAILSTIGTVSLVSYSRAQALGQTTNDLVQALNTAKSLAASQLKTLNKNGKTWQCQDFQTLSGFGVQINTAQGDYKLYIECAANGIATDYPPGNSADWQTPLSLNGDIIFDASTNITDVFFPVLSGGIVTKGSGNADSIVLSNHGSTKTISLKQGYISILP